jgi:ketosteroid isomerase-like protein
MQCIANRRIHLTVHGRRVRSNRLFAPALALALVFAAACHGQKETTHMTDQSQEIAALRAAYAAFNRGDIEAAVQPLSPDILWIEPQEFPGGGTYHGRDGAKQYLKQSRAGAAEVISEPERFIVSGDRIVVFVHARVLLKPGEAWQDIRLADVYTFRGGKAVEMHAFADRTEALRWAGVQDADR